MDIRSVVDEFTGRLHSLIKEQVIARARIVVDGALPNEGGRRSAISGRPRRKRPPQLCPVPGCKNAAAPIYGMVCGEHKDVPKAKIKKYRDARRAKKRQAEQ